MLGIPTPLGDQDHAIRELHQSVGPEPRIVFDDHGPHWKRMAVREDKSHSDFCQISTAHARELAPPGFGRALLRIRRSEPRVPWQNRTHVDPTDPQTCSGQARPMLRTEPCQPIPEDGLDRRSIRNECRRAKKDAANPAPALSSSKCPLRAGGGRPEGLSPLRQG